MPGKAMAYESPDQVCDRSLDRRSGVPDLERTERSAGAAPPTQRNFDGSGGTGVSEGPGRFGRSRSIRDRSGAREV